VIALKAPPSHHDAGTLLSVSTLVCPTPVALDRPILATPAPGGGEWCGRAASGGNLIGPGGPPRVMHGAALWAD
jgi:hypothetical protein